MSNKTEWAIVHNVKTEHRCIAICEIWQYELWGDQVNDRHCVEREASIPCRLSISNVPNYPGAKDAYRSFPLSGSFSTELTLQWELSMREVHKYIRGTIDGHCSDDMTVYLEYKGKPSGEVHIVRFEPFSGE